MTDTAPTTTNRTLRRLPNSTYRPREYLTEKEVDRLIEAARMELKVCIRCMGLNYVPCGHYKAAVRMCSSLKLALQLQQLGSYE